MEMEMEMEMEMDKGKQIQRLHLHWHPLVLVEAQGQGQGQGQGDEKEKEKEKADDDDDGATFDRFYQNHPITVISVMSAGLLRAIRIAGNAVSLANMMSSSVPNVTTSSTSTVGDLRPIINWVTDPSLLGEPTPIASLVVTDGCWKWEMLEEVLSKSVLQHLLATKLPLGDSGRDMPGWKWSETHRSISICYG
ncbi:hypothetical protein V6N13_087817 [Hibiscus sabdariffa]